MRVVLLLLPLLLLLLWGWKLWWTWPGLCDLRWQQLTEESETSCSCAIVDDRVSSTEQNGTKNGYRFIGIIRQNRVGPV